MQTPSLNDLEPVPSPAAPDARWPGKAGTGPLLAAAALAALLTLTAIVVLTGSGDDGTDDNASIATFVETADASGAAAFDDRNLPTDDAGLGVDITPTPTATVVATTPPTMTPVPPATAIPEIPIPTVIPTSTATPSPTPSPTSVPTTATAEPTEVPATATAAPEPTDVPATATPVPATAIPATAVPATAIPATAVPTLTPVPIPPTATPVPTAVPAPPTSTPVPTAVPAPPTATPLPTTVPVPATATPLPGGFVDTTAQFNASFEANFVNAINNYRASLGLAGLTLDPVLTDAARGWSMSGLCCGTAFGQIPPHNNSLQVAGARSTGENVGWGNDTWDAMHNALIASPGHEANIASRSRPFTHVGVGVVMAGRNMYVTQVFAVY